MNLTQKLAKKYRLSLNSSTKILKKKIKQLQKLQKLAKKLKIKITKKIKNKKIYKSNKK